MVNDTVRCFNCGEPVMELEPEGWFAVEIDTMRMEVEEMEIKVEESEDALEDAIDRNHSMRLKVREAKRDAEAEANDRNTKVAMKLCAAIDAIQLMDNLIKQRKKPTAEQLAALDLKRKEGGIRPI